MLPTSTQRIPIQLGRVALRSLHRGQLAMLIGVVTFAVAPLTGGAILIFALGMVFAGVYMFYSAYRTPATDLVFADGFVGPDDPFLSHERIRLDALDVPRCALSDTSGGRQLVLVARDGSAVTVASTADDYPSQSLEPDPRATIRFVFDALCGRGADAEAAPANPMSVEIVTCTSCGSAVPPDDRAQVRCPYCDSDVAMPRDVIDRVRASRELASERTQEDVSIRALLVQPAARDVRRRLAAAAVIALITWGAVLTALSVDLRSGTSEPLRFQRLITLIGGGFAVSECCLFLVAAQIERRRTILALMFGFGPKPPRRPGAPPCCHSCGAPLDISAETAVARCPYCGSENILGLALDGLVSSVRGEVVSLQEVLREHGHAMRNARDWTIMAVGALLMAVVAADIGAVYLRSSVEDEDVRCGRNDIAACTALARRYLTGDGVRASRDEALRIAELGCFTQLFRDHCGPGSSPWRACDPGAPWGCELAIQLLAQSPGGSPRAVLDYENAACEQGSREMCMRALAQAKRMLDAPRSAGRERAKTLLHHWCATQGGAACRELIDRGW